MQLHEKKHNIKEDLLENRKLAQYAYEDVHRVGWDEAGIL
jgi:hypothetical protein